MKINLISSILLVTITCQCFAGSLTDTVVKSTITYHMQPLHMPTRWAKEVSPLNVLNEYPRPQMERKNWENLNGLWEYAITDSTIEFPSAFDGDILVPYPIESSLSGVKKKLMPNQRLWYKKNLKASALSPRDRLILNFGAVDWQASIYINNKLVANHTNGYQDFSIDITDFLHAGNNELLVKVYDPTNQGPNPHGKQDLNPANIYYTPSSGIWQTVWLETVPDAHIKHIKSTPDIDNNLLALQVATTSAKSGYNIYVIIGANGKTISSKQIPMALSNTLTQLDLSVPNARLWSPNDPFLYDLSVKLVKNGKTIDEVKSYFGMRKINIQKDEKGMDRIFLNNKYTFNLGVLDQGFWPEGLYTAATDEALAFDIKAVKSMGFNTIRKHIKIEPERWYYHADKIGILVWQDFVNPPHELPEDSKKIFENEIKETMDGLYNHPCIVSWVIFNERWGVYDQQRITEWVKSYDPTRIINGHSGELLYVNNELRKPSDSPWISSNMTDVHSYPEPRNPPGQPGKAKVLGEFGGIGVSVAGHQWDDLQGWGYVQVTPEGLKEKYQQMIRTLKKLELDGLSGAIYTQPFDVEGEENGLITYDREIIKIPVNDLRDINKNLVDLSKGFSLDPDFFIATNIDINDNDGRYSEMLNQYNKGLKDSSFLRRLTLMALRKKDPIKATQIGNEYIETLSQPLSKENITFISQITHSTSDKGFELFNTQSKKINGIIGRIYAEYKAKKIIEKEQLDPYLGTIATVPAWDSLQQVISTKYGQNGEELILGKRMLYYNDTHDWKNYGKYYMLYYKKALTRPEFNTNNLSWSVFEHVDDPEVLEFAVQVMKYDMETWDQNDASAYDTYANLLHKVNKSNEAIIWEEKALRLKRNAEEEKVFAETLQKMKAGLPTWPQNN